MSTFPVNGYFKQLQGFYLAKAQRTNNYANANTAVEAGGFSSDSVSLSSDAVGLTRPIPPPNCKCYLDTLTTSDKAVVKAATGWDIDADPLGETASPEARQFVGRLNLDRSSGALKGDIDPSYIDKLIHENLAPQPYQVTVPLSVLYKAETYLSSTKEA